MGLPVSNFLLSVDRIEQTAAIGAPATIISILFAVAFMLVVPGCRTIRDDSVAVVGIAVRLLTIGALPIIGFCIGFQAVLGFSWGAQDFARVARRPRSSCFP
ncbi:MATE family efflux transporter [Mesorhizobium sp.]|uniref:MATE family efflux transporter n=1 Tax=Mesorhizobium sp. TaxID=1871066 RepID=UPI002583AAD9|nr:MATE family efflux transporter [Mesorhizobium sp.]